MKASSFFKGLSLLLVLNFLVKPVWIFFIDRQVQLITGHEVYGSYFAMLNLTVVLSFLADAGLSNMLNQKMASGNPLNIAHLLRIKLAMLVVYSVLCLFIAWVIGFDQWEILLYTILIQALTSLFIFLRSIITAQQLFQTDAVLSVLDKTGMILICGAMIYFPIRFGEINLLRFLQVQTACLFTASGISFLIVYQKKLFSPGKEKKTASTIIREVFPFMLVILLMAAHYRLDGLLLERLHPSGAYEAGVYAASYRLLDAANMLGYLAASFLVPFLAKNMGDKKISSLVILNVRHGLMMAALGVAVFTVVFATWIMRQLYHTSDLYHAEVLQLCLGSLPGYFLVHVYGSALTATHQLRLFIYILTSTVLLNAGLNLFLIPEYGAKGAGIAAVCSQYFCGFLAAWLASRRLGLPLHAPSILIYILGTIVLAVLFEAAKITLLNVWIILALGVMIAMLFLFTQISRLKNYFVSTH